MSNNNEINLDPNLGLTDAEKKKHDLELYGNAKINRHESKGETQARANRALRDIGMFIQKDSAEKAVLKGLEYLGSAAVHVYYSAALKTSFFVSQTDTMTRTVPEVVASDATVDLRKALMAGYGRTPTKKRSGF